MKLNIGKLILAMSLLSLIVSCENISSFSSQDEELESKALTIRELRKTDIISTITNNNSMTSLPSRISLGYILSSVSEKGTISLIDKWNTRSITDITVYDVPEEVIQQLKGKEMHIVSVSYESPSLDNPWRQTAKFVSLDDISNTVAKKTTGGMYKLYTEEE